MKWLFVLVVSLLFSNISFACNYAAGFFQAPATELIRGSCGVNTYNALAATFVGTPVTTYSAPTAFFGATYAVPTRFFGASYGHVGVGAYRGRVVVNAPVTRVIVRRVHR